MIILHPRQSLPVTTVDLNIGLNAKIHATRSDIHALQVGLGNHELHRPLSLARYNGSARRAESESSGVSRSTFRWADLINSRNQIVLIATHSKSLLFSN